MTTASDVILSHVGELPGVAEALPDAAILPVPPEGPVDPGVRGNVLITLMRGTDNLPEVLTRGVQWVHTVGTGVDEFPFDLLGDRILTCSRGANAVPIAEWVLAQILALEKQLPASWVNEPPAQWGGPPLGGVQGSTIAIFGLGNIGSAVASRALAFGANVRALRRRRTASRVDGVELVTGIEQLVDGADHVVLTAPATPATRGIVDDAFLAAMRPGAHLINVARASLVVEDALRAALDSGHLGCASIDVAPVEPLPAEHWFYHHPRVRFSPHVSWSGPGVWDAIERSFLDNYRLWRAGQPLQNVVDLGHGY